ncbi:ABC transporter ATP-binding protein [Calidithermus timidus]|jgi:ABC-2 type transport system ATP-binding protein|uniref:ABC transporter ATP-binding protein n=1 Tax=Calidithermus timidus TaxID=307124 RepID=UPI00035DFB9C|nr:ATP-binding cassette domain-containing protein [Calidithermus timidus]
MLAVECHELGRRFGAVVAVGGLSFGVAEGELFAFLGPNGAGKTTTLHMLITMLEPTSGWAKVVGFDVVRQAPAVRESIGVVFQEPALDERLSARENLEVHGVLYGLRGPGLKEAIAQALEWASLAEVARRPVRTFSGGMKRRLELARALMHTPKVLFLDEPTLGLDPQGRRHLWERIATLRGQGLTVFMTTHYLQEAEACDRVGIIDQGHLIALDTPAALKLKVLGKAEGSLEDVFLELTGRKLRDEEARPRDRLLGFARRGGEHTR